MSVRIKKINIQAFRGIPDLELEIGGKSLLLKGENGTGKSSIVDAIEYFFTGRVSHLEGVQGLSLQRHGFHTRFRPSDVEVKITFDPGNICLGRKFDSVSSPPAALNDYFHVTQKGTFILRRFQILEFINSKPAERFRAIGSILGIELLDDVELEMMRLRDELQGTVSSKKQQISMLVSELSNTLCREVKEVSQILQVLNEILKEADLPLIKSLEKVDEHAEKMLKAVRKPETLDKTRVINELVESTKTPIVSEEIINGLNNLNVKIGYFLRDKARRELSIFELLRIGMGVIDREGLNVCPLCEQDIDRKKLLERVSKRLDTLRNLSEKASEIRRISAEQRGHLEQILERLKTTSAKIEQFAELAEEKKVLSDKLVSLRNIVSKITFDKDIDNELPIQDIEKLRTEINGICEAICKKCSKLLSDIGLTDEEKKVLEIVRLIERVRGIAKNISIAEIELVKYEKYYELAESVFTAFSGTKKSKIQQIYNDIQGDIQKFYDMLHPNEAHGNIKLAVVLGRRASTEMTIESFGRQGEDPRAGVNPRN